MSDDEVGCEWVSVSSGTGLPRLSQTKAVKQLCVCVTMSLSVSAFSVFSHFRFFVCIALLC